MQICLSQQQRDGTMYRVGRRGNKNHSLCFLGWQQPNTPGLGDYFFLPHTFFHARDSNVADLKASVKLLLLFTFIPVYKHTKPLQSHSDGRKISYCNTAWITLIYYIAWFGLGGGVEGIGISQKRASISAQQTWKCLDRMRFWRSDYAESLRFLHSVCLLLWFILVFQIFTAVSVLTPKYRPPTQCCPILIRN